MDISVDVEDRVSEYLSELSDTLFDEVVTDAVHPYLDDVRDKAIRSHGYKRRTGKLERATKSEHNRTGGSVYLDESIAPYASYVHDGTQRISSDPFLEEATDDRDLDSRISNVIDKAIK